MNLLKSFEKIVQLGNNNLQDNIKFKKNQIKSSISFSTSSTSDLQLYPFTQKTFTPEVITQLEQKESKPILRRETANEIPREYQNTNKNKKPFVNRANTYYVLYVIDGDTFVALHQGEKINVRLGGIDAPEKITKKGKESKAFLEELIKKKNVYFDNKGHDKYGRCISDIFLDEQKNNCVNKILISEGYATSERYRNNDRELTHGGLEHLANEFHEVKAKFTGKGNWK